MNDSQQSYFEHNLMYIWSYPDTSGYHYLTLRYLWGANDGLSSYLGPLQNHFNLSHTLSQIELCVMGPDTCLHSDGGIKSRRVCFEVKKVSKLLLTRVFKAITLSMLAKVSLVLLLKAVVP